MNILLIEPDRILGEATKRALQFAGYEVSWQRSAQTALDAMDTRVPKAIVLEIQLGLHNGIEFLYEIQSYPEWQGIPILIYTANAHALDTQFSRSFENLQVRMVLYKPQTNTNKLLHALAQVVEQS